MSNTEYYCYMDSCNELKAKLEKCVTFLMHYIFEGNCKDRDMWETVFRCLSQAVFLKEYLQLYLTNVGGIAEDFLIQFECCDIVWIGNKPRQCVHTINDNLKKQIDVRAQALERYNPTFMPINLIQYMSAGGCLVEVDRRVVEQVKEDRDDLVSVSTFDCGAEEETDEEGDENKAYLG